MRPRGRKPWVPAPALHGPGTKARDYNPSWKQEDQKFKVFFHYIANSRPAWVT